MRFGFADAVRSHQLWHSLHHLNRIRIKRILPLAAVRPPVLDDVLPWSRRKPMPSVADSVAAPKAVP
jgi:hypothetical protein